MKRIFCMLPTYNEAENIGPLIDALLAVDPRIEALVVDDDSPDGTWRLVGARAEGEPRVHLLHRTTARGRGRAGIAGFKRALELGADAVVEMDADWSHDPKWIPAMIAAAERDGADVVIGSRLVAGGGEEGRHPLRRYITLAANFYIRCVLGLRVRDATSGYRLFTRRCVAALPWDAMRAEGPETVQEILLAAVRRGFAVREVPILFVERRHGESTFNSKIMLRSLGAMWRLRFSESGSKSSGHERLTTLPLVLVLPASWLYGLGRRGDHALTQLGLRRQARLPVPTICVGNLSVGGTGKSPFVRMLARQMLARGRKPAVLSRGYGASESPSKPLLVSDGASIHSNVARTGDEPLDLARRTPGVAVVVHPNRTRAGRAVIGRLGSDVAILDDGFQHEALARDLDLVLWDLRDEPRRARLLPAGRLREGLGALRRAGAIVLTHGEYLPEGERETHIERVMAQLKTHAPRVPIFEALTRFEAFAPLGGEAPAQGDALPWAEDEAICIVSGLASPEGFETMLRAQGAKVAKHFRYRDHHVYSAEEARTWREAMAAEGVTKLITTSKDAVKFEALGLEGVAVYVASICMEISEPLRWEKFIDQAVDWNR